MANWIQRLVSGLRARAEHVVETLTAARHVTEDINEPREVPEAPLPYEVPVEAIEPEAFPEYEEDTGQGAMDFEEFFEEEEGGLYGDEDNVPIIEEGKDFRGPFATREEAEAYADEIPVPTTVGKTNWGAWGVRIDYP